ncbi:phosphoenolpyruvate--protein phosphotransferase [Ruania alkalisoli]|uniref:Phosphoenolpyruvate-protein phosphotransferase n=1 Tax=Ruania alkalisoli TaxID=2779775 RepID=A0A7M1SWP5_9MICO|nr:phosphoenolpyruvate--protein phosphotransferase [Ruania alkalisoli]QOR71975.1 phosphoenolpyruvate--protein phosphotransferase [Ruania alkalisoli]
MTHGDHPVVISGAGVSPGRAAGPAVWMTSAAGEPPKRRSSADPEASAAAIAEAASAVGRDLADRAEATDGTARDVLEATAQIAQDPTLVRDAQERVRADRVSPERAIWEAAGAVADQFESLGGYLAERARDVIDVRDRIVAHLLGAPTPGVPRREEPFILLARDLAPADTAQLDPEVVRGLVTEEGGPTSHTAILARAIGIPAVVGIGQAVEQISTDMVVLVDGGAGQVYLDPSEEAVTAARERTTVRTFTPPGTTKDGHRVELLANVGEAEDAEPAAASGAEGVGLFRTEFCFLDRDDEPTIDEQVAAYGPVMAAFAGKKVVIRTLDAGADKPLPFLTDTDETNPALGVRGYRTSWQNPDVLDHQLMAIARAAGEHEADVWVMAPMISRVAEAEDFVARCTAHGLRTAGVMVEVPSAALLAGPLLARAAFASIGTNDLVQYTLAADRLLGALAPLSTPWDPAVLRLIQLTCMGGQAQGRPVGVCGEAAASPALAAVLVGLGVASLSMTPRALGDVAALLGAVTHQECQAAAGLALAADSADGARRAVREALPVLADLAL